VLALPFSTPTMNYRPVCNSGQQEIEMNQISNEPFFRFFSLILGPYCSFASLFFSVIPFKRDGGFQTVGLGDSSRVNRVAKPFALELVK
jgi:hypothetical protein